MKKTKTNLRVLTECSIMIALGTVLSIVKLFEMPYGGSITLASMLPIAIIAYRHGVKYGIGSAFVTSMIQMLMGLKNFTYFTTWQSFLALAFFDYLAAFSVFGLSGIFKKKIKSQPLALTSGVALASLMRYVCHVISGATIWAGLSIPTEAALVYSISYNATYMLPDTIILVLCALYVAMALNLDTPIPTRVKNESVNRTSIYCLIASGASALAALVTDTILVFSKLQNAGSGEFDITAMGDVNWIAVATVTAVCAAVSITLVLIANKIAKKK